MLPLALREPNHAVQSNRVAAKSESSQQPVNRFGSDQQGVSAIEAWRSDVM
jgi:hypothetical protein